MIKQFIFKEQMLICCFSWSVIIVNEESLVLDCWVDKISHLKVLLWVFVMNSFHNFLTFTCKNNQMI